MEITEVRIRPANEDVVKAYASICFDDCFVVYDIKVIQGPTGLFLSFPIKKLRDGTYWDIAYPADAETRRINGQAILAEDEKVGNRNSSLAKRQRKIVNARSPMSLRDLLTFNL